MNTTRLSLLTIAAALALAGCGNKGPLVLPEAPDETEAPVSVDETDAAANTSTGDATMDDTATDETIPAAEPIDDTDTPVDPEPLPQEDGDDD